jgi:hypothetical protein
MSSGHLRVEHGTVALLVGVGEEETALVQLHEAGIGGEIVVQRPGGERYRLLPAPPVPQRAERAGQEPPTVAITAVVVALLAAVAMIVIRVRNNG